ncbi:LAGLIDADG family homing endonuclease [Candidatus Pacearchaeota archaeon]|nr:LAGLIDADG family homing endonuclease [Candidatus Pacearchaeota archaeon]
MIVVTGSYYDDAEFFDEVLVPLFCSFTGTSPTVKLRQKYGARDIFVSNKELFAKIESLGFNSGKKKDILIPSIFDGDLMRFVLAGLFATDGCLTIVNNNGTKYPRMFFTACLPTAFSKVSEYLNNKGISANCYTQKRVKVHEKSFRKTKDSYVISSNGSKNTEEFRNLIGFINPKHESRYQSYLRSKMALGRIELPTSCL